MSLCQQYLVVGSGSIARRHIANLKILFSDAEVACVSASGRELTSEETGADCVHLNLQSAINARPQFAVVASPAPFHVTHASDLLDAGIPVLIEKPISSSMELFQIKGNVLQENADKVAVAYNMRYLTSALRIKCLLEENVVGRIYNVIIDVGQYLPDWRPTTNYRKNVSAQNALGGGVLLEMSHELDYLTWLFGEFETAYCIASNSGALEIDVEDSVDAILKRKDGLIANLHMDFLQRTLSRTCKVIGESGTLVWDLSLNKISLHTARDGEKTVFFDSSYDRNRMYIDELAHFAKVAKGQAAPAVDITQALSVLHLIEALKISAEKQQSVNIVRPRL